MSRPVAFVVEDEESFVEALKIGLRREGFDVEVAVGGQEAIEMFERIQPNVVLLDVMPPRRSGIDVCSEIRDWRRPGDGRPSRRGGDVTMDLKRHGDTKTLDVHLKRPRAKVETDPANPVRIVTIRGLGYKYLPGAPITED